MSGISSTPPAILPLPEGEVGRRPGEIITKCNCGAKTSGTGVSSILTWLEFAGSLSPHPDLLPKGEGMRMADFGRFVRPAFQARRRQYYLSPRDLSPLGTGERNSPQVKAEGRASRRERVIGRPQAGEGGREPAYEGRHRIGIGHSTRRAWLGFVSTCDLRTKRALWILHAPSTEQPLPRGEVGRRPGEGKGDH